MNQNENTTPRAARKAPSIAQIAKQDRKFLSKYAALFATVTGFLAITTAFGALGYKVTEDNRKNSQLLNAVGLEKTLSQQVSKDILTLQKEWKDNQKFNTQSFGSLTSAKKGFDELLRAFKEGGSVQYGTQSFKIEPMGAEYSADLEKIQNSWAPLRSQIDIMSKAYSAYAAAQGKLTERDKFLATRKTFTMEIQAGAAPDAKIFPNDFVGSGAKFQAAKLADTSGSEALGSEVTKTSNTYALYASELLNSVEKLNDSINTSISASDESNTSLQMAMSALSLLLFFILTFYFIRKNIVSDFVIFSEDKEKQGILDNINEGLFLMDTEWKMQSEGSKFLHLFFNRQLEIGMDFRTLLSESVDIETLMNAERFVNILVSKNIKGSMVDSLNPLKLVSLNLKDAMGQDVVKHVSVHFGQIHDANGKLKHLLVGIVDSTEKQKLSDSLKEEIKKNKETFQLLINIGKSEQRVEIRQMAHSLRGYLDGINNKMKAGMLREREYADALREIKNEIHGFKNDAGLLGVDILQKLLHDFEDRLIKLQKSGNITAESFLNLPYQFKEVLEALDVIELLVNAGAGEAAASSPAESKESEPASADDADHKEVLWIGKSLAMAVEQTASNAGKKAAIAFDSKSFENPQVLRHAATLRTALVHLVKNAVVHGIETPAERTSNGKAEIGSVDVRAAATDGLVKIFVRDDGAGLNIEAIKRRAEAQGANDRPIDSYTEQELCAFVFNHGFSTAETVGLDAGRGIGLDQVKSSIEEIGGKVEVAFKAGAGSLFAITLPAGQ